LAGEGKKKKRQEILKGGGTYYHLISGVGKVGGGERRVVEAIPERPNLNKKGENRKKLTIFCKRTQGRGDGQGGTKYDGWERSKSQKGKEGLKRG